MPSRPAALAKKAARFVSYLWTPGPRWVSWATESLLAYGHFASQRAGRPVDRAGQPLPWYTYPAIEYLNTIDLRDRHVFEFGSGNSSLFWADRASSVTSIEHDAPWFETIKKSTRANQTLLLVEDREAYVDSLRASGRKYGVIVVDGERRERCARAAIDALEDDGFIVFDNADWWPGATALLRAADLIQVDFTGFGPANQYVWTTSLFLRRNVRIRPARERMPEYGVGALRQVHQGE